MNKLIINQVEGSGGGKGGGGGSRRVAREAPDSLRSKQFARVLDLLSEGEIEGLVGDLKGVYLDETPIQNEDDSFNFDDVVFTNVPGTQSQDYIPGFPNIENENSVNVEVKNSQSATRQIANSSIDAIRVSISLPQLTNQNTSNGDLNGSSAQIAIDVQSDGGGFVEKLRDTISGKTTSRYQRDYRVELTGSAPWDIRVRRITADSNKSNVQNKTFWDSYTEIIDSKLSYPNSAIAGTQVDAEQFSAIPKRAYHLKGIKVRVPSNYDPATRSYAGHWDGTFKIAWTDNPAWCFYDLCTEKRYGLGEFLSDTQVDKWELYTIGQYCDQLVDDGFGGQEPRFTCNLYLQTQAEAYNVLMNMASIFRGILFWGGGSLNPVQDRPGETTNIFTPANVVEGIFNYSGTAKNARHTVALVSWNDPEDFYRQKVEYVEDAGAIALYGYNPTEITAFGCTSRGQAHRLGKWLLITETVETETVSFKVGLDGAYVVPGNIIKIQDPSRAGKRFGGRIKNATSAEITLDSEVELEQGKTYKLTCVFPDGTNEEQGVTNTPGTHAILNTDTFSQVPQKQAIWILAADDLVPQQFKVISISETGKAELAIVALKYNPGKFAAVESGIKLEPLETSSMGRTLSAPVNLTIGEYLVNHQGKLKIVMTIGWNAVPQAVKFQVKYKKFSENYIALPETSNRFAEVFDADPGTYKVEVVAVSIDGRVSPSATVTGDILGSASVAVMPNVTGLKLFGKEEADREFTGNDIKIIWDEVRVDGDPEASIFEDYEVRVLDENGNLLRVEHVKDNHYIYSFEKNAEDGGPNRTVTFEVRQRGKQDQLSYQPAKITVTNPVPKLPTGVLLQGASNFIFLNFNRPDDLDFSGTRVWLSKTSGFTPDQTNQIDDTSNIGISIGEFSPGVPLEADTDYYLVFSPYDAFGTVGSIMSPEFLVRTATAPEANIAANSITADKYNQLRNSQLITVSDSLDDTHPFEIDFPISSEMVAIKKVKLSFKIKPFRSYSKAVLDSGSTVETSSNGGGTTVTSTQNAVLAHNHDKNAQRTSESTTLYYSPGERQFYISGGGGNVNIRLTADDGHTHTVLAKKSLPLDAEQCYTVRGGGDIGCASGGTASTSEAGGA